MQAKHLFSLFSLLTALLLATGCASREPQTPQERQTLHSDSQGAIENMVARDPELRDLLNNSAYGYAIFPSVGKGGALVGGAYGRGEVYSRAQRIGYAELQQATVGAQLGGETYRELIIFQDSSALERFKSNNYSFSANASAVAFKSGASRTAKFDEGVVVFTDPIGGGMLEASIGGQKFTFQPLSFAGKSAVKRPVDS